MGEYMVESYVSAEPSMRWRGAAKQAEAGTNLPKQEGNSVRYVRSIFVPEDETCLHVFEGPSLYAIQTATERAGIRFERIVEVMQVEAVEMPGVWGTSQ